MLYNHDKKLCNTELKESLFSSDKQELNVLLNVLCKLFICKYINDCNNNSFYCYNVLSKLLISISKILSTAKLP